MILLFFLFSISLGVEQTQNIMFFAVAQSSPASNFPLKFHSTHLLVSCMQCVRWKHEADFRQTWSAMWRISKYQTMIWFSTWFDYMKSNERACWLKTMLREYNKRTVVAYVVADYQSNVAIMTIWCGWLFEWIGFQISCYRNRLFICDCGNFYPSAFRLWIWALSNSRYRTAFITSIWCDLIRTINYHNVWGNQSRQIGRL